MAMPAPPATLFSALDHNKRILGGQEGGTTCLSFICGIHSSGSENWKLYLECSLPSSQIIFLYILG